MVSFIIRQLVLFCHMSAVYNAAFHPYHVLDRCTAHDVGISGISLTVISMEITQMSLTIHISSVQHTVSLLSALHSRVFNLVGYMYFYNTYSIISLNPYFYSNCSNKHILIVHFYKVSFNMIV